jgi:nucleosome binding factor SPN SPT16 subunit
VKQKGDLELHENGLKFICQATRTEFEFVFANVQYAFFQKAGRNYKEVMALASARWPFLCIVLL